jgi:predicted GNAT family acetyltransferase
MIDHAQLDRPAYHSLHSGWRDHAIRNGMALRLDPDFGPFGASASLSHDDLAALAPLVATHGEIWLVEPDADIVAPLGTHIAKQAEVLQMVAETLAPFSSDAPTEELRDADGPEMRALALLTEPGPFAEQTHRLGSFHGVRRDGRIAAMAGERMRFGDFVEVSGVCTHPDHWRHGYAAALTHKVASGIVAAGKTPFLHCYPGNDRAVALYERLGFRARRTLTATVLAPVI